MYFDKKNNNNEQAYNINFNPIFHGIIMPHG